MAPGGMFGRIRASSNAPNDLASSRAHTPLQPAMPASALVKRGRGPTIGLGLERLNRADGKLLRINVDEEKGKPLHSTEASKLSSEIGIISREFIQVPTVWKKLEEDALTTVFNRLEERFEIDTNKSHVEKSCVAQLKVRVRANRHKYHKKFLSFNSEAESRQNPPPGVDAAHWKDLVDMWTSEKFKAKSAHNKKNRSKVTTVNRMGSKCFEVAREEMRNKETNEEKDPIDFYKEFYYTSEGWSSARTEAYYDAMMELKARPAIEGQNPLNSAEIVREVLGKRAGYTMSLGLRTRESGSTSRNEVLHSELQACKQQVAEMSELMKEMSARQKIYEELYARMAPASSSSPIAD